jgi:hypothetical protein
MEDKEQIMTRIARLREFHAMDRREQLGGVLRRLVTDPLKPKTDKGKLRIHPILALLMVITLLTGGTFLFFTFVQL